VKLTYVVNNWAGPIKKSWYQPLDVNGKQEPRQNFCNCGHANNCVTLNNGKFCTCAVAPYVYHFNNYFNQHFEFTKRDYIDIYKAKDIDEILSFLAKPIPFCKYCNLRAHKTLPYQISKKEISEWI
ncbi:MAG: hypothetical protein LBN20_04630, partial [Endomicrobium sp.]|nr:hypothetical protein [Endomicrobium sp.]